MPSGRSWREARSRGGRSREESDGDDLNLVIAFDRRPHTGDFVILGESDVGLARPGHTYVFPPRPGLAFGLPQSSKPRPSHVSAASRSTSLQPSGPAPQPARPAPLLSSLEVAPLLRLFLVRV